ncbi:MAG: hypothetical protein O9302_01740 [Cyclobacteriaceae bacterium]|jgi:hypothetical protein|nr:hypothetical protein [Cytophagales bacterium]MCZ8326754.1 hypothetical protein [Cyclobacteriaceae bacterium]
MKKILIIVFIAIPFLTYSQENGEEIGRRWMYTSTSTIEFQLNNQSGFSNQPLEKGDGNGFEINSMHGVFLTKRIVFSLGTGINYNSNLDFQSVPLIVELKYYFKKYSNENGLYVLLNTGKHLQIGDLDGGQTAKLGAGYVIKTYLGFDVCLELFAKSKTFTDKSKYEFSYNADSFGFALGIKL